MNVTRYRNRRSKIRKKNIMSTSKGKMISKFFVVAAVVAAVSAQDDDFTCPDEFLTTNICTVVTSIVIVKRLVKN